MYPQNLPGTNSACVCLWCMMMWHYVWWCDTTYSVCDSLWCMMMWHYVWWGDTTYSVCDSLWCMMMWHYVWWCDTTYSVCVSLWCMMMWHYVWWCDTAYSVCVSLCCSSLNPEHMRTRTGFTLEIRIVCVREISRNTYSVYLWCVYFLVFNPKPLFC